MKHKLPAIIALGLCLILALCALAVVLFGRGSGAGDAARTPEPIAATEEPQVTAEPTAEPTPTPTAEPTPSPTPTPTAEPTPTPWPGPVVTEQPGEVTADYFADAGFLGNSVLSGLYYYDYDDLLPKGSSHWYWDNSLTILGASSYAARMKEHEFGKIYVGFGVNELNSNKDTLRMAFNTVIDQLQSDHPDAIIYLVSVTPVSKYCDANRAFKRDGVLSFNEMLQDIAREQQVWYLDVYPCLTGDDGFLPSNVTNDGVHFNGAHYEKWFDYMKTHYVPDGTTEIVQPSPEADPEVTGGPVDAVDTQE